MDLYRTRRRPATSFVRSRNAPSVIVDRYSTKSKLAKSEVIQRPTTEGLRANYLKLTKALEEDKINQKSFLEREKVSNDKSEREKREAYHSFCVSFANENPAFKKKFEEIKNSARRRSTNLRTQTRNLEDLEREAYRVEMGLDDPPINEDNKKPISENKNTNYGNFDAKFYLSLSKFKASDDLPK